MSAAGKRLLIVTADDAAGASLLSAAKATGWSAERRRSAEGGEALEGVVVLDDRLPGRNCYELCRALASKGRARVFVAHRAEDASAASIARFCGAEGTIALPAEEGALRRLLARPKAPPLPPESNRGGERSLTLPPALAERMLRERPAGEEDPTSAFVEFLCDPETKLFNAPYLLFKLDEEFKRAIRFKMPLACLVLGFEGEASAEALLDLASVFLLESRDVDVLGRFDLNRFVFLLPNTGEEGTRRMATRIVEAARGRELRDLAGDPLLLSVGFAVAPGTGFESRDDLLRAAQAAFERAREEGGGIETGGPSEPPGERKSRR
ncbi:MAG TPA: diguanylate cyclase [Planctomycetota bacterium]|jgi:GGDEF domain-containing protein|nr:diguanylate cyclase [Planctomycetota bacterium]